MGDIQDWWGQECKDAEDGGTKAAEDGADIDSNPHYPHNDDPADETLSELWDDAYKAKFREINPNYFKEG